MEYPGGPEASAPPVKVEPDRVAVKEGLEKVRMLPAVNGGPRTHMSLGPYDHKAYKGDWLVIRRIEGGRTVFVGLHDLG